MVNYYHHSNYYRNWSEFHETVTERIKLRQFYQVMFEHACYGYLGSTGYYCSMIRFAKKLPSSLSNDLFVHRFWRQGAWQIFSLKCISDARCWVTALLTSLDASFGYWEMGLIHFFLHPCFFPLPLIVRFLWAIATQQNSKAWARRIWETVTAYLSTMS